MIADGFTKPLVQVKLQDLITGLGLNHRGMLRWARSDQINCTWIAGVLGLIAMEQSV